MIAVASAIEVAFPMIGWQSLGSRAEIGRAINGQSRAPRVPR